MYLPFEEVYKGGLVPHIEKLGFNSHFTSTIVFPVLTASIPPPCLNLCLALRLLLRPFQQQLRVVTVCDSFDLQNTTEKNHN